ncbi:spore gernimation protein KA [Alkalihalophilus pseudofirmus]|uniref:spore germination protein GerPB n=1 Tax=Alkalihalobacterium alkalinitrilicum TaxID=427920 RepID=UPI00094DE3D1|nr:spore germination protein GerPB [Alkalihalobacterium alkalinitrilicum]OLO29035.1 spore gernimation protein KA [Alkalihalophilus pseudofirmus]
MNFFINQNIVIHTLRVDGITNSSVLQIGSAGMIKGISNLYNTGGFTEPAPEIEGAPTTLPYVPLAPPSI